MSSKQIGIGVIGLGGISEWGERGHIPAIKSNPQAKLVMVCDVNGDRAKTVGNKLNVPFTTERSGLLENKEVDAVVVALPHKFHCEVAVDALNSGKHVMCEKPLAMKVSEVDEMSRAADKNGVVLMTAENYLFDPGVKQIIDMVDSGRLGRVLTIELEEIGAWNIPRSNSAFSWRLSKEYAGGGILIDSGVHLTALALRLGGKVSSLIAKTRIFYPEVAGKKVDVEDEASVIIEHENGALSSIYVSGINRFPRHGIEVHGTKGSVRYRDESNEKPQMDIGGFEYDLAPLPLEFPSRESYRNELKHFLDCVSTGKEPITGSAVGRDSLDLVLKSYESSDRNERAFF